MLLVHQMIMIKNHGDSKGNEVRIRQWYSNVKGHMWKFILRYPDANIGEQIAEQAIIATKNDNIGYSMESTRRGTFLARVKENKYKIESISQKCDADCSAFVGTIVTIVGHNNSIPKLEKIGILATGNMENTYSNAGFNVIKDKKYLTSSSYLQPGDIMVTTWTDNKKKAHGHTEIYVGEASSTVAEFYDDWGLSNVEKDESANLDELNFDFAGTPKRVTYSSGRKFSTLVFSLIGQFADFIVNVMINGLKYSILGWSFAFESIVNNALKSVEK